MCLGLKLEFSLNGHNKSYLTQRWPDNLVLQRGRPGGTSTSIQELRSRYTLFTSELIIWRIGHPAHPYMGSAGAVAAVIQQRQPGSSLNKWGHLNGYLTQLSPLRSPRCISLSMV